MPDAIDQALIGTPLVDRVAIALRDHHRSISDQIDGMTAQELWQSMAAAAVAAMPRPIDWAIYPLKIDKSTRWDPAKALATAEQDRREGRDVIAVALYPIGDQQ